MGLDLGQQVRVERASRWEQGTIVGLHGPYPRLVGVDVLLADGSTVYLPPSKVRP